MDFAKLSGLDKRVAVGKLLGLGLGGLSLVLYAAYPQDLGIFFTWFSFLGLILFGVLFGAMIGLVGLWTKHPLFGFRLSFWGRGPAVGVGAFLMLGFLLIEHDSFANVQHYFGISSWKVFLLACVAEGAFWGLVFDGLLTRWFGEGKKLL